VGDGKRIIIISITVSGINDYELTVAGLYKPHAASVMPPGASLCLVTSATEAQC